MRSALHTLLFLSTVAMQAQEVHEVLPLPLGPASEDYAPVLLRDGFLMCSIRETGAAISFKDAETGKPLADLYWVPLKGDTLRDVRREVVQIR